MCHFLRINAGATCCNRALQDFDDVFLAYKIIE
jgi:hypothetical protein